MGAAIGAQSSLSTDAVTRTAEPGQAGVSGRRPSRSHARDTTPRAPQHWPAARRRRLGGHVLAGPAHRLSRRRRRTNPSRTTPRACPPPPTSARRPAARPCARPQGAGHIYAVPAGRKRVARSAGPWRRHAGAEAVPRQTTPPGTPAQTRSAAPAGVGGVLRPPVPLHRGPHLPSRPSQLSESARRRCRPTNGVADPSHQSESPIRVTNPSHNASHQSECRTPVRSPARRQVSRRCGPGDSRPGSRRRPGPGPRCGGPDGS